jgi:hypothetical protein
MKRLNKTAGGMPILSQVRSSFRLAFSVVRKDIVHIFFMLIPFPLVPKIKFYPRNWPRGAIRG